MPAVYGSGVVLTPLEKGGYMDNNGVGFCTDRQTDIHIGRQTDRHAFLPLVLMCVSTHTHTHTYTRAAPLCVKLNLTRAFFVFCSTLLCIPSQDDLDSSSSSSSLSSSGLTQKTAVLPAVDDVMAAVFNTTSSWKKERVQPLPQTIAQQKGDMCTGGWGRVGGWVGVWVQQRKGATQEGVGLP